MNGSPGNDLGKFLAKIGPQPSASATSIAECEQKLGRALPAEYVQFLSMMDGGEGFINREYVIFYSVGDIISVNQSDEIEKAAPGLVVFGSDGGGEAYGFDTRDPKWPVVQLPFIGMEWSAAWPKGDSFYGFLVTLYESD